MIESGRFSETDADVVQQQYTVFQDGVIKQSSQFATFNPIGSSTQERDRVDSLLCGTMSQNQSCKQLWTVVKHLLLLSHGQATVERDFSVNKEIEVENLAGSTFAAKRMVSDHIQFVGGIKKIDVSNKQLLLYCASAQHKYSAYLEDQKKNRSKVVAGQKRKALSDEVSELKAKRKALQTDAEALSAAADDFSEKAEKLQQLTLVAKANGMRRAAREKTEELKEMNQLIDNKMLELANYP